MKVSKNTAILSGALATLIAHVTLPLSFDTFVADGFYAKYISPAAMADDGEDDDSEDDSSDDSSDDDSGDDDSSDDDSSDDGEDDDGEDDDNDDGVTGSSSGSTTSSSTSGQKQQSQESSSQRVQLQVSASDLQGLLDGSLKAVDQLGRVLEIEVETEHGTTTIHAEAKGSSAITSVSIVPK